MPPPSLTSHRLFSTLGTVPVIDQTPEENSWGSKAAIEGTGSSSWTMPFRDGLPTPPSDMTGVAYNAISTVNFGGKSNGMPSHLYGHARPHVDSTSSATMAAMKPQNYLEALATEHANSNKSSSTGAQPRIPSSINNSKGTLAEFAAQMTCLFWFEKTSKLQSIEDQMPPLPSLVAEAIPTVGFQKWVATILSTTQVSQNVILLALLFIYRLKKFNSGVKGKKGSEFRLMTVALMLGNKFLDDNTYTNKTWAEVSGIAVQEIHIMEVEFLSNIRYNLFASESEWAQWYSKLGLFGDYFNQASMLPAEADISTPLLRVSPPRNSQSPLSKLPSPPVTDPVRPLSQPNWYLPDHGLPYAVHRPPLPQQIPHVALGGCRKRNRDEDEELHPMKRTAMSMATSTPALTIPSSTTMNAMATLPPMLTPTSAPAALMPMAGPVARLPLPNLPASSHPMPQVAPSSAVSQLPAIMPPVYNRVSNWVQQMPPASVPPVAPGLHNAPSHAELSRNQSSYGVSSATVSPAVSAYSVHTPQTHLSPSFFLANRNSPYRPVRSVHTLLIPPPSASLQQQRSVPFDHMHYQLLGKTSADRKTGLLPYIQSEAWNQGPFLPSVFPPTQSFSG